MRGIHSVIDDIRRKVFEGVAQLSYQDADGTKYNQLAEWIVPDHAEVNPETIEQERAVAAERVRLACGLSLGSSEDEFKRAVIPNKYYEPPLINVIPVACNACPEKKVVISSNCQGCFSRPCQVVCPKKAVHTGSDGKSVIDQSQCVKCGRCVSQCPYDAISSLVRPCAQACGVDAIGSDEAGRATINPDKCVSCGSCLVSCPFGAIADKSQILQTIQAIRSGDKVIACFAPAFVSQFGKHATPAKLRKAMRMLGFTDSVEVAIGADMTTVQEATEFLELVPEKQPFMGTSCCPAWSVMAKKQFPDLADYISMALTPMVFTARLVKMQRPDVRVAFIGPCVAKKLEASRRTVRSDVDFVLTFEELQGMFDARGIDFEFLEPDKFDRDFDDASGSGRSYAITGGVAGAVAGYIATVAPDLEVKSEVCSGLKDCKKMLMMAKNGKRDGYLLEGMACVGGCIAGAGTITPVNTATKEVHSYSAAAAMQGAEGSAYLGWIEEVVEG